jgi:hypothetical protein
MRPENKRRIGEAVVLILYFIIDGYEVWPTSHLIALLIAVVGISAVVYAEAPIIWWFVCTAMLAVIAWAFYFIAPPIPPEETQEHGWLEYASIQNDAIITLLGNNVVFSDKPRKFTALTVGHCPVVLIDHSHGNKLFVDADVFNSSGYLAVRIQSNEFHLIPTQIAFGTRPDRSTLTVTGPKGEELFWIRYLNPKAVQVRGVFACENHRPITVTDDGIVLPNKAVISGNCAEATGRGLWIGP